MMMHLFGHSSRSCWRGFADGNASCDVTDNITIAFQWQMTFHSFDGVLSPQLTYCHTDGPGSLVLRWSCTFTIPENRVRDWVWLLLLSFDTTVMTLKLRLWVKKRLIPTSLLNYSFTIQYMPHLYPYLYIIRFLLHILNIVFSPFAAFCTSD